LTFDLEGGVRVTCDVGYVCANFGLPRPVLDLGQMYATDRQTDVRQTDIMICLRRWIQLRFDFDMTAIVPRYDSHSTAIRPRCNHTTTYVTMGCCIAA